MPGGCTSDAICGLEQTVEKHREVQKDINLVFLDLDKAYNRIPSKEVWRCAREQQVLEKYTRVIHDMHR